MAENLDNTVSALLGNLENYISAKTIVGEPIQYKDIVVFPMAEVSFGIAAGSFSRSKDGKNNGAGGAGARLTPSAVLIIQNGTSKVVNIKDKDSLNKLIDMIPDLINKLTEQLNKQPEEKKAEKPKKKKRITDDDDFPNIEDYIL